LARTERCHRARRAHAQDGEAEGAQAAPTGEAIIKARCRSRARCRGECRDNVAAKQGVVILEAMKMENELRTPRAVSSKKCA